MDKIKKFTFLLLSTTVIVFFSEKSYWYIQGYQLIELILYYMIPTVCFLWIVDWFQIQNLPTLFLAAAIFGFVTEGVLTPILYKNGIFDLFSISYTSLGWHALISIVFGWYFLHKWLIGRNRLKLLIASGIYGIFWGTWSLVYWLPENVVNSEFQPPEFIPGPWPVSDFILFTFSMTLILITTHWLLGIVWQKNFKSRKQGLIITALCGGVVYINQVLLAYPWAPIKFLAVTAPTMFVLNRRKKKPHQASVLDSLSGRVYIKDALILFVMPLTASLVYTVAYYFKPEPNLIYLISAAPGIYGLTLLGWIFWIGSMISTLRNNSEKKQKPQTNNQN